MVVGINIGLARRIKLEQISPEVDWMHIRHVNVPLALPQGAISVLLQELKSSAHTENG